MTATQAARTRAPAVAPRTSPPAPVTVVNAAAAELGRNCKTESTLAGSSAPARVGQHHDAGDQDADAAGRAAQQDPQTEADQRDRGEVSGHPEHRAQDAGVGERDGRPVTGGEDSHADTEGGQDTDQCRGKHDAGEHDGLGDDDLPAPRHGRDGERDHARAVLAGAGEGAQDADQEHRAKSAPVRTVDSGSPLPNPPPSPAVVTEPVDTAAAIAPRPTSTTTTPPMPIQVLRRVRSLIHSEWIARPSV